MNDRTELIASFEGRVMGDVLHNGGYIHVPQEEAEQILALLKEQPEQKFFVDSDGKITPLPIQKRGHWKQVEEGFTDMMCSECGELALLDLDRDFVLSKYCPNCGARMDEEVKQDG